MSDDTYNGWVNRETWALMIYASNEEGCNQEAVELAVRAFNEELESVNDGEEYIWGDVRVNGICKARDAFNDWAWGCFTVDGYDEQYGGDMPMNLARIAEEIGSLWRVDFYECSEALLADRLQEFDAEFKDKT